MTLWFVLSLDFRFFFAYHCIVMSERPEILNGRTFRVRSPFGTVFVTLNENQKGYPFELFLNIGKSGSDIAADAEAIGRLCTLLLRIPSAVTEQERIQSIIKHLMGIGGSRDACDGDRRIRSMPDAVAFALTLYLRERTALSGSNAEVYD